MLKGVLRSQKDKIKLNKPCIFNGNWYSENVATLVLDCRADESPIGVGTVIGTWNTPEDHSPIEGRYTHAGKDVYLGFTVVFKSDQSASSLTGMYYKPDDSITTFWIMTNKTAPQDIWQSFRIGKAVFNRVDEDK